MKPRWLAIAAILALPGCAFFTVPVHEDREAVQAECLKSALCRTIINDRPAWTERYVSDRRDCKAHALEIARQARDDGRSVFFAIGTIRGGEYHAVAVVEDTGEMFAFDNGAMSAVPIPFDDLSRHMTVRMLSGEAAILAPAKTL